MNEQAVRRVRMKVGPETGSLLAVPDLVDWQALVTSNQALLDSCQRSFAGVPLAEFRQQARTECVQAVEDYHRRLRLPTPPSGSDGPWIVTGHQPELFHAGVWIKNSATSALAKASPPGSFPLHVIVDNDTFKRSSIAVPTGRLDAPLLSYIPFDGEAPEVAYEERKRVDDALFREFPKTVQRSLSGYPIKPLLATYWGHLVESPNLQRPIGELFSRARRVVEEELGIHNAEVPVSMLSTTRSFGQYFAEIARHAREFAEVHNQVLIAYRRREKIRSSHHPVRDLEISPGHVELPFWTWSEDQPTRRRLFLSEVGDGAKFFAGDRELGSVSSLAGNELERGWAGSLWGWKVRPRALTNTLFLRLALADLFIHGIGGGLYDELTDEIMLKHYGIQPPRFAVLSATALLRLGTVTDQRPKIAQLQRKLRDFRWNPDRYLDDSIRDQDPILSWVEEKADLTSQEPASRKERCERFAKLREMNQNLARYLGPKPTDARDEYRRLTERESSLAPLRSREFAYVLHDRESIEKLFKLVHFS